MTLFVCYLTLKQTRLRIGRRGPRLVTMIMTTAYDADDENLQGLSQKSP